MSSSTLRRLLGGSPKDRRWLHIEPPLTEHPGTHPNVDEPFGPEGSIILPLSPLGTQAGDEAEPQGHRKGKRVRLLLDARTELTNEELEVWLFRISHDPLLKI